MGLLLVAVGAPAAYFGLHLGRAGTVEPRDVRFLFRFGLHLVGVGRFLQLCPLEGDAYRHGLRDFLV